MRLLIPRPRPRMSTSDPTATTKVAAAQRMTKTHTARVTGINCSLNRFFASVSSVDLDSKLEAMDRIIINSASIYPENTGTNSEKADKLHMMKVKRFITYKLSGIASHLLRSGSFYSTTTLAIAWIALSSMPAYSQSLVSSEKNSRSSKSAETKNTFEASESPPLAFRASYAGLLINQTYSLSPKSGQFTEPKLSWGGEYRFFYKDQWTLSVTGEFKGQEDIAQEEQSTFNISQETMRLVRLYHPWYLALGGRLSYLVPVKKISIPYERDPKRNMDTGGSLSIGSVFIVNERLTIMLSTHRWTSFRTSKNQGLSNIFTLLMPLR